VAYYNLVSTLKRRLLLELQDSFSRHPIYSKIVPFIQNKYSFSERPQMGIVLKGASANKVVLSGDNFVGMVQSYCMLATVGQPASPLEWIREDSALVEANGGRPPSPPGVYYIEVLDVPDDAGTVGHFVVDPLLTQTAEPVLMFQSGVEQEGQLQEIPVQGTLRLWLNTQELLQEGVDYQVGLEGSLTFIRSFNPNDSILADYRYATTSVGPVEWRWNQSDAQTIPGVVLAWGKRARAGDKVAVVISADRLDAAKAFGGKFEVSFDLDCIARDPVQLEEIGDLVVMSLWHDKKPRLEAEGIELLDVSLGGESEESYDENAGSFFYMASVSVQLRADWEVHEPLPLVISRVSASGIHMVNNPVYYATEPFLLRPNGFERIG
jgi:hypothetical protein